MRLEKQLLKKYPASIIKEVFKINEVPFNKLLTVYVHIICM